MNENPSTTTDAGANPEVEADLYVGREQFNWIVPRCPYCGHPHQHGAGGLDGDPERSLGPRVPHCCRSEGGRPDYILVPSAQAREELPRVHARAARKARGERPALEMVSLSQAALDAACREPLWLEAAGLMRSAAAILERSGEGRLDSAAWRCADAGALLRLAIERQFSKEEARECLSRTGRGATLPHLSAAARRGENLAARPMHRLAHKVRR